MDFVEFADNLFHNFVKIVSEEHKRQEFGRCNHRWGNTFVQSKNILQKCRKCGYVRRVCKK